MPSRADNLPNDGVDNLPNWRGNGQRVTSVAPQAALQMVVITGRTQLGTTGASPGCAAAQRGEAEAPTLELLEIAALSYALSIKACSTQTLTGIGTVSARIINCEYCTIESCH